MLRPGNRSSPNGRRCWATTAPRSRSCATCPSASAHSVHESRRPSASGWPKRPPSSPSRATTRRRPRRRAAFSRRGPGAHCRILAARCSRRHPRADPVLPHARHQRLAMGLDADPGRRSRSGGTRSLPNPPRQLREHGGYDCASWLNLCRLPGLGGPFATDFHRPLSAYAGLLRSVMRANTSEKACVLRVDLEDFFPSMSAAMIKASLQEQGYEEKAADLGPRRPA